MSAGGSTKVIVLALGANLGIAISKFAGSFITGSAALLAEAIHSLVDSTNQVLLLIGDKAAARPATERHPLGYGREAFFWSFIVAILLFSLGGLFAIYEGSHKLHEPEAMSSPLIALSILGVGIVLEAVSLNACLKEVRAQNRFGSLWAWFRKTTSAPLLVVFTEDLAAMAGLVVAALSVLLSWTTGNPAWDAYGSIAVGTILVLVAILLALEIKSLIIGEAPAEDLRPAVEAILSERIPGARVLNLLAVQIGSSEIMLSYKVTPGSIASSQELIQALNDVEVGVKKRFPEVKWQFIEPDFLV